MEATMILNNPLTNFGKTSFTSFYNSLPRRMFLEEFLFRYSDWKGQRKVYTLQSIYKIE